jgi:hypothetical protein
MLTETRQVLNEKAWQEYGQKCIAVAKAKDDLREAERQQDIAFQNCHRDDLNTLGY